MSYTIYGLFSKNDPNHIRYVGYTKFDVNQRLKFHLKESNGNTNTHKLNWIRKMITNNVDIKYKILEICKSFNEVNHREEFWIKKLADEGHNLTNGTIGGGGVRPTQQTRIKMSKSHIGIPLSESHKKALSESHKGKNNYLFGKSLSTEQKQKISTSLHNFWEEKKKHDTIIDKEKRSNAVKKSWILRRKNMKDVNHKKSDSAIRAKRWRDRINKMKGN